MNEEADRYYYDIFPVALNIGEEIRHQQITDAFKTGVESMEVYKVSYEMERNRKALADHNIEVLRSKLSEFGKKAKWHDLVKNPNDLPEPREIGDNNYHQVIVKCKNGRYHICALTKHPYEDGSYFECHCTDVAEMYPLGGGTPIAWKEVE